VIGPILRIALREIRYNFLRSGLTVLGIIIGVAAVIIIVTLGSGATARITADISSLGRNLLIISPGTNRQGGMYLQAAPFVIEDALAIEREVKGLSGVAPIATKPAVAVAGNQNWTTQVTGSNNAYAAVREWPLALGRPFTAGEERSGAAVCVLGETVRTKLFGAQNPLGARLRVGNVACEAVAVLTPKGKSTFGTDQDDLVVMPLKAVQRRLAGNRDVNYIFISTDGSRATEAVKEDLTRLLRAERKLGPSEPEDFTVNDMAEITGMVERTTGVLTAMLGAIAAVSLVVGGIGIMNIMLVSVTERTREIGIRLAVGALARDVLVQFLIEAMLLAMLGGLIGVAVGSVLSLLAARMLNVPLILDLPTAVIAVAFSALVGIAFGFFPARRAARLDPIQALRYE
jgi:putative ABC transport system permease protein